MRIRNFYKVNELLACAGQPNEGQLKQLAAEGYQVVVNLGLLDTAYALPDEAALVTALGIEYHHIPVVFDSPQISELAGFMAYMERQQGKKIMVHCAANYRASVFTALYLYAKAEIDEAEVHDLIDDIWQPNKVWEQFLAEGLANIKKIAANK